MWQNVIIFGTVEGLILALLALGFSLVYGVGGVLNLAHGAFYLVACYALYWTLTILRIPLIISIILTLAIVMGVGAAAYLGLMEPLQESEIGVIIATFSLAFFLQQFVIVVVDPKYHGLLNAQIATGSIAFLGVVIPSQFIVVVVGSIILMVAVSLFISKTKIGKSIQAVSQDREAAQLMGIDANRVLMITVMISAFLAGMGGILYAPTTGIQPYMGWGFLISAFAVTIFGGKGSILGSILGALIMGYARAFCSYYISTSFAELVPLIVIVIMLLIRPRGLLGKKELM